VRTSDFFAKMSHELRTPLNAMIGFSELLLAGAAGELTEQQRRYVGDIDASARQLLVLVTDIVELSKLRAGAVPLEIEPLDVVWLIADTVQALAPVAAAKDVEFVTSLPPEAHCAADRRRLRQVVGKLVASSLNLTRAGGQVAVRAVVLDDHVRVDVEGSGPGISPADLADAFEPFSHAIVGSSARGDLGLSIARELIVRLGGTIEAESTPGHGTAFHLKMPLSAPDTETLAPAQRAPEHLAPPPPHAEARLRAKVLVVDDNPVNRRVAQAMLQTEGSVVLEASSAAEGLDVARSESPDVVLMDMSLPDMDGAEATRLLLSDARTKDIAVIGVSAHTSADNQARAKAAGCLSYVTKPIARRELIAAVRAAVDRPGRTTRER
jgi:CheY-like chemotaxis protein